MTAARQADKGERVFSWTGMFRQRRAEDGFCLLPARLRDDD
jgi:hypothetical protein